MQRRCVMIALKTTKLAVVAASLLLLSCGGRVEAAPVPIVNHSFEAPDVMGGFQNVLPDNWAAGGGLAAQWVENNTAVGFSGGDGSQHAGLDTDGGYIYQDSGVAFAANTKYTIDLASTIGPVSIMASSNSGCFPAARSAPTSERPASWISKEFGAAREIPAGMTSSISSATPACCTRSAPER